MPVDFDKIKTKLNNKFSNAISWMYAKFFITRPWSQMSRLRAIGTTAAQSSLGEAYENDTMKHKSPLCLPMARIPYPVYLRGAKHDAIVDVDPAKWSKLVTPPYMQALIFDDQPGNTLFVTDYKDRGDRNAMKEDYMHALTGPNIERMRTQVIEPFMQELFHLDWDSRYTILQNVLAFVTRLSHLLHFGRPLDCEMRRPMQMLAKALCHTPKSAAAVQESDTYAKYFRTVKKDVDAYLKKCIERVYKDNCYDTDNDYLPIVYGWRDSGRFSMDDCYVEFVHNVVGLNVQWTVLMTRVLEHHGVGTVESGLGRSTHEILASISPSLAVVSVATDASQEIMHPLLGYGDKFLRQRANHGKQGETFVDADACHDCPFLRARSVHHEGNGDILVAPGTRVLLHKDFLVFGDGFRRCPGEWLTYQFLEVLLAQLATEPKNISQWTHDTSKTSQQFGFNAFRNEFLG